MLESIFEWLTNSTATVIEIIVMWFMNTLGFNVGDIAQKFPILQSAYYIFRAVGLGLVAAIAIISIIQYFGAPVTEIRSTPIEVALRAVLGAAMVYMGGYIAMWILDVAKLPYDAMMNLDAASFSAPNINLTSGLQAMTAAGATGLLVAAGPEGAALAAGVSASVAAAMILIDIILIIVIGVNVLKLMIETCERLMMVVVLLYTGPLAYATVASKSTSHIFKKWLSMFIGQCLLMTLSVWSLKAIISGFSYREGTGFSDYLIQVFLVVALCRIALRIDTYLQQLGLNTATTGMGLAEELFGGMTASGALHKVFNAGGDRQGSGNTVLGGGGGGVAGALGRTVRGLDKVASAPVRGAAAGVASVVKGVANKAANGSAASVGDIVRNGAKFASQTMSDPFTKLSEKVQNGAKLFSQATGHEVANKRSVLSSIASSVSGSNGFVLGVSKDDKGNKHVNVSEGLKGRGFKVQQGKMVDKNGNQQNVRYLSGKNTAETAAMLSAAANQQEAFVGEHGEKLGKSASTLMEHTAQANPEASFAALQDNIDANDSNADMRSAMMESANKLNNYVDAQDGSFENVQAYDRPDEETAFGTLNGGHVIEADYTDSQGNQMHMQALDETAYNALSNSEQKHGGYTEVANADGSKSYVKTQTQADYQQAQQRQAGTPPSPQEAAARASASGPTYTDAGYTPAPAAGAAGAAAGAAATAASTKSAPAPQDSGSSRPTTHTVVEQDAPSAAPVVSAPPASSSYDNGASEPAPAPTQTYSGNDDYQPSASAPTPAHVESAPVETARYAPSENYSDNAPSSAPAQSTAPAQAAPTITPSRIDGPVTTESRPTVSRSEARQEAPAPRTTVTNTSVPSRRQEEPAPNTNSYSQQNPFETSSRRNDSRRNEDLDVFFDDDSVSTVNFEVDNSSRNASRNGNRPSGGRGNSAQNSRNNRQNNSSKNKKR